LSARQRTGVIFAAILVLLVTCAPWIAPYDPARQFSTHPFAPPMRPHVIAEDGALHAPFVYAVRVVDPLERQYLEDHTRRIPLQWFSGTLVRAADKEPWFPLGSDALGRDVFSRVVLGARLSLGVALLATVIALAVGALVGAAAGYAGGWPDSALMHFADLVLVLPGIYVVLALRGALPLVLTTGQVFTALVLVLGVVGWPSAARAVRGIFIVERMREYAEAARAAGAGPVRVIWRHLLPASLGFLAVQACVLMPAFVMAEATMSYVGLGFAPPTPSWGAMLQDAAAARGGADAPWLLAPAGAIVLSVFTMHLLSPGRDPLLWGDDGSKF
jgi:peptide/nickel transport system permease protein